MKPEKTSKKVKKNTRTTQKILNELKQKTKNVLVLL